MVMRSPRPRTSQARHKDVVISVSDFSLKWTRDCFFFGQDYLMLLSVMFRHGCPSNFRVASFSDACLDLCLIIFVVAGFEKIPTPGYVSLYEIYLTRCVVLSFDTSCIITVIIRQVMGRANRGIWEGAILAFVHLVEVGVEVNGRR